MSQENVEFVKGLWAAGESMDKQALLAALPDLIELERCAPGIARGVFLARHADHVGSPGVCGIRAGAGKAKLDRSVVEPREDRLHDALAVLRQDHRFAILQIGDLDRVGAEILARGIPQRRQPDGCR